MSTSQITDLYEVTMALAYLRERMTELATFSLFSLFSRKLPPGRGFLVSAGLESALDYLERWRLDDEDIAAFAAAVQRPVEDLEELRGLRFTGRCGRYRRAGWCWPVSR